MKKLNSLKLSQLSKAELEKVEMDSLKGGGINCGCGCYYQGEPGGSTSATNASWNLDYDIKSPGCQGDGCRCVVWPDGVGATATPTASVHA